MSAISRTMKIVSTAATPTLLNVTLPMRNIPTRASMVVRPAINTAFPAVWLATAAAESRIGRPEFD